MSKSLVIVESPAKAKTINKFLGTSYVVKPTGGHLIDLPPDEFGIDIEDDFKPTYRTIKGKNKILQDLKKAAKQADTVLLATDPDREGEAIAWHVANNIIGKNQPSYRILINQITRDAVTQAIENKMSLDLHKVDAQQARRVLDRLVGYQVSPLLWKTIYRGLSAGRVQSVALRLIVERDAEIDVFVPEEYWYITAVLSAAEDVGAPNFEARVTKKNGEVLSIGTEADATAVVDELRLQEFAVADVARKKNKRKPSPPFITSTMQQDAARRLRFNVTRTMKVAQTLYEGIDIGSETVGLITYMRTDSTRIAPEALSEVRSYITAKYGEGHLPSNPNLYRAKKGAQDAHEAIRPTTFDLPPEKVKKYLTVEQYRLYTLIWNRFVASQMKSAEYDVLTIDIAAGPYELRTSATTLTYKGFLLVYEDVRDEDDEEQSVADAVLPDLATGDRLYSKDILSSQHFTKPPPRFSEASLVKELESLGIGRPSTYAQIINTIIQRKYVDRNRGRLTATELGKSVNKILVDNLPNVFNVDFTANMEEELDKIEAGAHDWRFVVNEFYGPFSRSLDEFKQNSGEVKNSMIEETDETCDQCGSPMIIRWGRNGKFLACSAFPKCKSTRPLNQEETEKTDTVCDKCGSPMQVKRGRYGRFLACSNYPACKNIKPYSLGVPCPEEGCNGEIVEKSSKKGRIFYGCSNYPACKFASWDRPVAISCPDCDSPALIETKSGEKLKCPRCRSSFDRETLEQPAG